MTHTIYLPRGEAVCLLPDVQEALGRLIHEKLGPDAAVIYDTLLEELTDKIDDLKSELADERNSHLHYVTCPNCETQIDLED